MTDDAETDDLQLQLESLEQELSDIKAQIEAKYQDKAIDAELLGLGERSSLILTRIASLRSKLRQKRTSHA
jgi:hypothetical protein